MEPHSFDLQLPYKISHERLRIKGSTFRLIHCISFLSDPWAGVLSTLRDLETRQNFKLSNSLEQVAKQDATLVRLGTIRGQVTLSGRGSPLMDWYCDSIHLEIHARRPSGPANGSLSPGVQKYFNSPQKRRPWKTTALRRIFLALRKC